jgi:choline kinase
MKAIILAAGQGKRLRPLTADRPKAMIDLKGRTLLDRQIERFHKYGIHDITVVTGYCEESVRSKYPFRASRNEEYSLTNMTYSLFCAKQQLQGNVIVSYGDILYDDHVMDTLLSRPHEVTVAVDMEWKSYYTDRFGDPFADAESLLFNEDFRLSSIGKGSPNTSEVMAQYIGLIKISESGCKKLLSVYDKVGSSTDLIGWGRTFREAYLTDFLQELISRDVPVHVAPIRRGWFEIDSMTDYELVQRTLRN